uniref:Uncharacterized protein n=1 Tax=Ditylenchus dipsaci TaxID=166011 RepID=A0A915DZR2_9BILA
MEFLAEKLRDEFLPPMPQPLPEDQAHIVAIHNAKIKEQQLQERRARRAARPKKISIYKYESPSRSETGLMRKKPLITLGAVASPTQQMKTMIDDEEKTKKHEKKEGETLSIGQTEDRKRGKETLSRRKGPRERRERQDRAERDEEEERRNEKETDRDKKNKKGKKGIGESKKADDVKKMRKRRDRRRREEEERDRRDREQRDREREKKESPT